MKYELFRKTLISLGFREIDAKVYLLLAKKGPQKGRSIAAALELYKQQLYRSLSRLQKKRLVISTLERPARFSAVSFEKVLEFLIEGKKDQALALQKSKEELLSTWRLTIEKNSEKSYPQMRE